MQKCLICSNESKSVLVTDQEISELRKFVLQLNSIKDGVVVVEGKRDFNALRKLGCKGKILEFHKFGGINNFADSVAKYKKIILLFDRDKKGRYLTGKVIQLLQRRTKIDLSYKRKLRQITRGKIMSVEQLVCYAPYFS